MSDIIETKHVRTETITANRIVVGGLVLTALDGGDGKAGLWIGKNEGDAPLIAIYNMGKEQTAIGIYGPGPRGAMEIALMVDENGGGAIQFVKGDRVVVLDFDDVAKLKG